MTTMSHLIGEVSEVDMEGNEQDQDQWMIWVDKKRWSQKRGSEDGPGLPARTN